MEQYRQDGINTLDCNTCREMRMDRTHRSCLLDREAAKVVRHHTRTGETHALGLLRRDEILALCRYDQVRTDLKELREAGRPVCPVALQSSRTRLLLALEVDAREYGAASFPHQWALSAFRICRATRAEWQDEYLRSKQPKKGPPARTVRRR